MYGNYYQERGGFLSNLPQVTRNLLIINVLFFVATLINEDAMIRTFALFFPSSPLFRPWQIVTHMFMHGDFFHIFFNMYSLVMFGSVLERSFGTKRYLVFFAVCGLGAALLHMGVQALEYLSYIGSGNAYSALMMGRIPTLGASGAVYGVILGFAMMYPSTRLTLLFPPITMRASTMVLIFAAIEFFAGLGSVSSLAGGVAHFAHLGGMLAGWLLIRYWMKRGDIYRRY